MKVASVCLTCVLFLMLGAYADEPVGKPNIIVIVTDDLGYADVLFNPQHSNEITTPNLDSLAKESVICRQGYVTGNVCSTTRTGLNLANFIRDIRKDLGAPNLPFAIAETGMSGRDETHPRALSLMKAQAAVAEHNEFQGNVAFVGTRDFYRPQEESPSGQAYHWNSNAQTYYLIGAGMGKAMPQLTNEKK